jgi:hypothetical protein
MRWPFREPLSDEKRMRDVIAAYDGERLDREIEFAIALYDKDGVYSCLRLSLLLQRRISLLRNQEAVR